MTLGNSGMFGRLPSATKPSLFRKNDSFKSIDFEGNDLPFRKFEISEAKSCFCALFAMLNVANSNSDDNKSSTIFVFERWSCMNRESWANARWSREKQKTVRNQMWSQY